MNPRRMGLALALAFPLKLVVWEVEAQVVLVVQVAHVTPNLVA